MRTSQPVSQYVDGGVLISVYPEKKTKRQMWMKNDTFYGALMRIDNDSSCFAVFTRKRGKA